MIKVNDNKNRTTTSVSLLLTFNKFYTVFSCFHCYFEQVNAGQDTLLWFSVSANPTSWLNMLSPAKKTCYKSTKESLTKSIKFTQN